MQGNRTYRIVDGERIDGVFRPIFIRNGADYYLTDLKVFADGAIFYWEWGDLDGLRAKLEAGWVATTIEEGSWASAHDLARWRFGEAVTRITAEQLLGEVVDAIDRLNGRPDSTDRCITAVLRYVDSRAETDRIALRAAYEAIPAHHRIYALGDMDARDIPLRLLVSEVGEIWDEYVFFEVDDGEALTDDCAVTEEGRRWAFQYFADWRRPHPAAVAQREADGPAEARSPTVYLNYGRPMYPRAHGLRNDFPAPIRVADAVYPTVEHAYWALSANDESLRERIRTAPSPGEARDIAAGAERRPHWSDVRLTVMADLMRAKFVQHPDLAEVLLATGDGRIHYSWANSQFWDTRDSAGRNWLGRLLELVRTELVADRIGFRL
ncbi:NADAR family protein [Microbispora sp. NPDC049125]|uniref:NADAR family protein n=1 Tax=Microbispora sp. NPDC049125 TaxID=3154929 RepID=UPI003467212A